MFLSELSRNNWTTSLCPFLHAHINAVRPQWFLAFKSMFLSELSRSNWTTSLCPCLQASINAVNPNWPLTFSPLSSVLQCSRSCCTTLVSPFRHAFNILPFHLLIKTFSASSFQVFETKAHWNQIVFLQFHQIYFKTAMCFRGWRQNNKYIDINSGKNYKLLWITGTIAEHTPLRDSSSHSTILRENSSNHSIHQNNFNNSSR